MKTMKTNKKNKIQNTKKTSKKYNNYRQIIVVTASYDNPEYKKIKEEYNKNIKEFHKRHTRFKTELKLLLPSKKTRKKQKINKSQKIKKIPKIQIKLIGYDGLLKKKYNKFSTKKIFRDIDNMPLGKIEARIKPVNLGLYADYKPETTTPGLGFKNKEKALYTLEKIKNRSIKYQISVVTTMIGRAKFHPHKTKEMEQAIKIFEDWLKKNKKKD